MKFAAAVTNTKSCNDWFIWRRGQRISQGSAVPFQTCMNTVSRAMEMLNDDTGTSVDQYKQCIAAAKLLRSLLTDVFPTWTHRQQSTQELPDAREPYVYGLYCYARGHAYGHVINHLRSTASATALAQSACNAAHLKFVAAQLLGETEVCTEAHAHAADMMHFSALDLYSKYTNSAVTTGIGAVCACQQLAVSHAAHAGLDTSMFTAELNTYLSCNAASACEDILLPSTELLELKLTPLQ